jgi:hypothetical protein
MSVELRAADEHDERSSNFRFQRPGLTSQTYADTIGENVTNTLIDKFLLSKLCRSRGCTSGGSGGIKSIGMMADDPGGSNSLALPENDEQ